MSELMMTTNEFLLSWHEVIRLHCCQDRYQ